MELFMFRMGTIYKFFNTQIKSEKARQMVKIEWFQSLRRANIHPTEIFTLVESIKYTYDDYPNPSRSFIEWARKQSQAYRNAIKTEQENANAIPHLIAHEKTPEQRQANIDKARAAMRRGDRKNQRTQERKSRLSEADRLAMEAAQLELEQRKLKG